MAKSKRTPTQIQYDRAEIARRYLKGELQSVIAESLGVSQPQISYDLARIREKWIQSALVDFNEIQARELARIDLLEREYWTAWDRSITNREITSKKIKEKPVYHKQGEEHASLTWREHEVLSRTEERDGNPEFLAGVRWCIEQRCKIFGLYEPEKFALVDWRKEAEEKGIDVTREYEQLVSRFANALQEGFGADGSSGLAGGEATGEGPTQT